MLKRLIGTAFALAVGSSAMASVVASVDIVDSTDGVPVPPAGVVAVDVFVDVTSDDTWTAGGVAAFTGTGVSLIYATDPNTHAVLLTNPGTANKFVTFFTKPRARDANGRFSNSQAAAAGRYSPTGPTPTSTPTEVNVAYFASPPETAGSPSVDGYVFRIAFNYAGNPNDLRVFQGTTNATNVVLSSHPGAGSTDTNGTVNATFDVPALTGLNWYIAPIPEPASLALLALGGLLAIRRR